MCVWVVLIRVVLGLVGAGQNHNIMVGRRRADDVLGAADIVGRVIDAKDAVVVETVVLEDD